MTKPTSRKKRSKLKRILLFPILAPIFLVGWSLNCIGQSKAKQPQKPINKTPAKQDEAELIIISPQEKEILTNQKPANSYS